MSIFFQLLKEMAVQAMWFAFQIGVMVAFGTLIAELIAVCCYAPTYMDGPRFYAIPFVIGAICAIPATIFVSDIIAAWRSKSVDVDVGVTFPKPFDNRISGSAPADRVPRLGED